MKNVKIEVVAGTALITLGLTVISGWILQIPLLVQIVPGFVGMVFNTALCFTLAGIALAWPKRWDKFREAAHTTLGVMIIVIPLIVSIQNFFSLSFGIDNYHLHAWLNDSNPHPGRMAPNTSLGFILSGLIFLLLNHRSKLSLTTTQLLTFIVILIGITGTVGYFLKLELMYNWYQYTRMALHTAMCFIVLGIGLCSVWYHSNFYYTFYRGKEDQRIAIIGAAILVTVAITSGLSGFASLRHQMEMTLGNMLQLNLSNRVELFENTINQEIERSNNIAKRSSIIENLKIITTGQATSENYQVLNSILGSTLYSSYSAITIVDNNDTEIVHLGHKKTDIDLEAPLRLPFRASLIWSQEFFLKVAIDIFDSSSARLGTLITEAPLKSLTKNLVNYTGLGTSGELAVCHSSLVSVWCFPMRNRDQVVALPPTIDGQKLPITYAIAGQKGVMTAKDYRRKFVVAAFSPIGAIGLAAVLKMDTEELYAPIRTQLDSVVLLILFLVLSGVILLRLQVIPLVKRLVSSEQQARNVSIALANAVEGIAQVNDQGMYTSVNQAYADITGYTREELIGKSWFFWINPDDREKVESAYQLMLIQPKVEIEVKGFQKDGFVFETSVVIIRKKDNDGVFIGHHCFMKDITARKRAEIDLKISEVRFRTLAGQAPVGIYLTDPIGKCSYVNQQWCDLSGINEKDAEGTEWLRAVHFDDKNKIIKEWKAASLEGKEFSAEFRFEHSSGKLVWVSAKEVALLNNLGAITGYLGTVTNIDELKKIERMKNEFISTVSHELRTPLTSIRGSLGLLAGDIAGPMSPQAKQLITIANQNSERLLHLINDILDIEKIEAGKLDFHLQNILLLATVKKAISNIKNYSTQQNIEILLEDPAIDPLIRVDEERLLQVMANLLSNAIKFSPKNSTINVTVKPFENVIEVAFSDHGPGIPIQFQNKIFQKFAQADSSDTRQKGGTGLGLSIAKLIIEQLNGSIGFRSPPNEGATFYIRLPYAEQSTA